MFYSIVYPAFIQSVALVDGLQNMSIDVQKYPQGYIGNGPAYFSYFEGFQWESITDPLYYGLRYHKYFNNITVDGRLMPEANTVHNNNGDASTAPTSQYVTSAVMQEFLRLMNLLHDAYHYKNPVSKFSPAGYQHDEVVSRNEHITYLKNFSTIATAVLTVELLHMNLSGESTNCTDLNHTPGDFEELGTRLGIFLYREARSRLNLFRYCRNAYQTAIQRASYKAYDDTTLAIMFWQDHLLHRNHGFVLKYEVCKFGHTFYLVLMS